MKSGNARERDKWVLWLTGIFAFAAIAVFAFAIVYNRQQSEDISVADSPVDRPHTPSSGEFRVVHVADGDSLTLVGSDNIELSVRLYGIDAPELGQPYGFEAKQALNSLVASSKVSLGNLSKGKYGRYVANVFVADVWVNKEMIVGGYAWCDQVNAFDKALYTTERDAKKLRRGLWAAPDPVPPWVWRAERK